MICGIYYCKTVLLPHEDKFCEDCMESMEPAIRAAVKAERERVCLLVRDIECSCLPGDSPPCERCYTLAAIRQADGSEI